MSSLFVYHESSPEQPYKILTHLEDISATLAEHGVAYGRMRPTTAASPSRDREQSENDHRLQIDGLMTQHGHTGFDVVSVSGQTADSLQTRSQFLDEHVDAADEVRLLVLGQGLLALHIEHTVYLLLCEKHDLVSIPAGTRRWFDMGEHPQLTMIRTFSAASGSELRLTGDAIASLFPRLDDF